MLRAGRLAEAIEHVADSVDYAANRYHSSEAAAFLAHLLDDLPSDAHRLRYGTLMRLASLQHLLGRPEDQRATLERATEEADAIGETGLRARIHAAIAAGACHAGNYEEAEREALRGLALADEAADAGGQARCLYTLGVVEYRRGDFEHSATHLRAALKLQRESGDRRDEAHTLLQLGAVVPEIGEGGQALELKQSALSILRELEDRRGEGAALNNLGNTYVELERIPEALVCFERSTQIARELGDLPAQASAHYNMGRVYTAEERIDDAKESLECALGIFRELGDPSGEACVLDELGSALSAFGEFREALAAAERTGENALRTRVLRHLGTVHLETGERDTAWELYESALALAHSRARSAVLSDMGRAAERDGDLERAVRLLQDSLEGHATAANRLLSLCRLARVYQAAGRSDDALATALRAEAMMQQDEGVSPTYGPEVFFSLGTVFGKRDTGRDYLSRAKNIVDARTRSIRSIVYRQHYLTTHWPNREILQEVRHLADG
jgi:tetratricopeptide (TPR) repeat protein